MKSNIIHYFFSLVAAGLWEKDLFFSTKEEIDFSEIFRIAEEQSVEGLVAAGLEHLKDYKIPKEIALTFAGITLQLEQRNTSMNDFISVIVEKMRAKSIYTLLLKGQGIACCYHRPLWRACGDIDFFLSDENYKKAKGFLLPLATSIEPEGKRNKHVGMTLDSWVVELHGSLRCGLSPSLDRVLDDIYNNTFYDGAVRSWMNGDFQVFLLNATNDAAYVFTHFLSHFYKGGVGLRQICDWCRLLWTYKDEINHKILLERLKKMKAVTEWKAFGAFAVEYLGMPKEAMPFYDSSSKWRNKANRIKDFILMSGNFGHSRNMDYYGKYPYLIRKVISMGRRIGDLFQHARIFPLDSLKFLPNIVFNGLKAASRGE